MPLHLKSGFMTSSGAEARLLMDSGAGDQIISITIGALEAVADPPRADEFRLQNYIDTFSRIAGEKYDRAEFDLSGHVRVTADDVRAWRSKH